MRQHRPNAENSITPDFLFIVRTENRGYTNAIKKNKRIPK